MRPGEKMKKISEALCEGVTLHYISADKFTSNYSSVHFVMPLAKETVSLFSLLSKVFTNGSAGYPSKEAFSKRLADLYATAFSASCTKIGEEQTLSLSVNVLDNRFAYDGTDLAAEAFSLLADVITAPVLEDGAFVSAVVEREKKILVDEIDATINNKNTYALKRCREIMCAGELYSLAVEGDRDDVKRATAKTVYDAYQKMLREARIELIYIGREDLSCVRKRMMALAKTLGERQYKKQITETKIAAGKTKRVEEKVSAVQGKLAMGFRTNTATGDADLDALRLFNMVYGSSPVSKLFMNVREKLSLCYYCASRFDAVKGVLFVYSGVENKNMTLAEEEIVRQLEAVRLGKITDEEMLCAKKSFSDMSKSVTDSVTAMERWILDKTVSGEDRMPDEVAEAIEKLTVADVARVAAGIQVDTVFTLVGEASREEGTQDEA